MDDLVVWLHAQLDEDERAARAADEGPWQSKSLGRHDQAAIATGGGPTALIQFDGSRAAANGTHVARHDPARVLREIDAKRQLVELHAPGEMKDVDGDVCMACDLRGEGPFYPCATLRLLALPYADRPGYREEWAP
jgi:hypothetical protein